MDAFTADHRRLSTDPESQFVQHLVLSRRDADGANLLRGLGYERAGAGAERRLVESEAELFALIGDVFGVDVGAVDPEVRRRVWARAEAAHREYLATRAAGGH
jgi:arylamine N-acetyltransferase